MNANYSDDDGAVKRELRAALDTLAPTVAMQRADLERLRRRRRARILTLTLPLAAAAASFALFIALSTQPHVEGAIREDLLISVDDGSGPLVIFISGGTP